jgi:NAD+ synthetase
VKIALAQIDTLVGDVRGNEGRITAAIHRAARDGAELLVLPELAVTGYPPEDLLLQDGFVAAAEAATARLAEVEPELPVLVGTVRRAAPGPHGRRLRNTAALLHGGRIQAWRDKVLLPRDDVFFEPRWFDAPSEVLQPIDVAGQRVGVLICEDLWDGPYARSPLEELRAAGADLLVCLNASPYRRGIQATRQRMARRGLPLVYVNAVGAQDELVFDGSSFVLDADGRLVCELPCCEEALVTVDTEGPPQPLDHVPELERTRRALVLGVQDFVLKNRLPGVVVGLSGGIDSALVLCLAADALGPERVRAIHLPSRFTSARSTRDSEALCAALGVELQQIPLDPLHQAAAELLDAHLPGGCGGNVDENLQARLRGTLLMAVVNRLGGAVLNTSNKTELGLGYGTLYGDMVGALAPIGDLPKPLVRRLAAESYRDEIPRSIVERAPSAELAPDQVDPFDYPQVAPVVDALTAGTRPDPSRVGERTLDDCRRRFRRGEFKRRQAPPALKVSDVAFGRGRQVPVTRGG